MTVYLTEMITDAAVTTWPLTERWLSVTLLESTLVALRLTGVVTLLITVVAKAVSTKDSPVSCYKCSGIRIVICNESLDNYINDVFLSLFDTTELPYLPQCPKAEGDCLKCL